MSENRGEVGFEPVMAMHLGSVIGMLCRFVLGITRVDPVSWP